MGRAGKGGHTVCLCRRMRGRVRTDTRAGRGHSLGWRPSEIDAAGTRSPSWSVAPHR